MSEFNKFTSIESFAHVYRGQEFFDARAVVTYGAKIKLHGTNAAVRVDGNNNVHAQSRSRDITPTTDNCGFARWVHEHEASWKFPNSELTTRKFIGDVTYYGEWAGKGIQKGDAVAKLDQKYFFIFAVENDGKMFVDPAAIESFIPDLDDVIVLPWDMTFDTPVNFNDADQCQTFADMLNGEVKAVEEQDPFIYGIFGVEGPGEGWVLCPMYNPGETDIEKMSFVDRHWYNYMTFKVKTDAHMVQKTKKAVSKDIEVPAGVVEFVAMFVTPARCEQGLTEIGGVAVMSNTGNFLKWLGQDVKKESETELADAGLEWKDVTKHVTKAAQVWFIGKTREIV